MRRLLFVLVLLGLGAVQAGAQLLEPVKWSYAAKRVSPSEAVVYVKATIDKGWHIYSTLQKDGGPVKTSFSFASGSGAGYSLVGKVVEGKPVAKFEKTFDMEVQYFEGTAVFSQRLKLVGGKGAVVKGKVEFMACTDTQCLPPSEVSINVVVK